MRFFDCKTAPSPRRVRIFMAEKGLDIPPVQVDLAGGEQLGDAFRDINPDCTVPVLQLDDGPCLTEVFAICQYLEEKFPEPALLGRSAIERALVTMWNAKIELHGFLAVAETFRNRARGMKGRALTGPDDYEQIPELIERGRRRFDSFMARLNGQLHGRKYVVGDDFTIVDISAMVAVDFAARSKISMPDDMTALRRWHAIVAARPSASA
ncbi:MAG: glutathione S-transferase family protein [Woeseia sp.]